MNTAPVPIPTARKFRCEFDRLRFEMRQCVRRARRRPHRMAGVEVAYLALADWLALVAASERG